MGRVERIRTANRPLVERLEAHAEAARRDAERFRQERSRLAQVRERDAEILLRWAAAIRAREAGRG